MSCLPMPAVIKPKPLWTGKQIMSLIIPNINLMRNFQGLKVKSGESGKLRSNFAPTNDKMVIIQKGELIQGELTKATVGSSSGGLNHIIWKESGA